MDTTTARKVPPYEEVERILAVSRSVWKATEEGLVHRSDPTNEAALKLVTATPGSATTELKEAWEKAHARYPNPGDAWDHAIKAVEAVLIPIVIPLKDKPNLGGVIGTWFIAKISAAQGGWGVVFATGAATSVVAALLWLTIDAGRGERK